MRAKSKRAIRLLITLLIAAGVIPFFYPWHDPLLSWQKLTLPQLPEVDTPDLPPLSTKDDAVTVYRWQDASGSWHFGNQLPQGVEEYQRLQIDPNTNVVQSVPILERGATEEQPPKVPTDEAASSEKFGYSAEEILKLVGQAEGAREAMDQRLQQQEAQIRQGQ
ncbi:MAG: DUF4124 domain-containing protein [Pseudomonadota bacterium]